MDHDDTSVNSTEHTHYPAYLKYSKKLRPNIKPLTLDEWFERNSDIGIMDILLNDLGLNKEELKESQRIWREYCEEKKYAPDFYPGFINALEVYKNKEGIITVVSHSRRNMIEDHYKSKGNSFMPDFIFGWSYDRNKRKPHPYPIFEIVKRFEDNGISLENVLVIDDLKPGYVMARDAGVDFAAAGWGHNVKAIEDYMKKNSVAYFETVPEFRDFILKEAN